MTAVVSGVLLARRRDHHAQLLPTLCLNFPQPGSPDFADTVGCISGLELVRSRLCFDMRSSRDVKSRVSVVLRAGSQGPRDPHVLGVAPVVLLTPSCTEATRVV